MSSPPALPVFVEPVWRSVVQENNRTVYGKLAAAGKLSHDGWHWLGLAAPVAACRSTRV
jgi:hypothetical protein